jgi:hypothetical protein
MLIYLNENNGDHIDPLCINANTNIIYPLSNTITTTLIGYYRNFVKKYGNFLAPLTSLLQKNAFVWSEATEYALSYLKDSMCMNPILVMPYFLNTFFLECDALDKGLGALLMQEGCPLTFVNKQLCDCNLGKSTYEKDMVTILHAIET